MCGASGDSSCVACFSTLLTLFWFGCWVTRPRSPPSAEDEKVVFVTKFGKSALENTSINVEPSNLVFYKGNSTGLRSTRHFEYFVVFLVHRLWQSSTMSFAARTSPAHTTPATITATPTVISAAPSVTVAAPAPALSTPRACPRSVQRQLRSRLRRQWRASLLA